MIEAWCFKYQSCNHGSILFDSNDVNWILISLTGGERRASVVTALIPMVACVLMEFAVIINSEHGFPYITIVSLPGWPHQVNPPYIGTIFSRTFHDNRSMDAGLPQVMLSQVCCLRNTWQPGTPAAAPARMKAGSRRLRRQWCMPLKRRQNTHKNHRRLNIRWLLKILSNTQKYARFVDGKYLFM